MLACLTCNSIAGGRVFASFDAKRAYILAHRLEQMDDPAYRLLTLCVDCYRAFRPNVDGATLFLCPRCVAEDEAGKRRGLRETGAIYVL